MYWARSQRTLVVWAAGLFAASGGSLSNGMAVWVAPSTARIAVNASARSSQDATIQAGRGEYESFQVVVRAPEGGRLTGVRVELTDLTGSRGVIPSSSFTLYREHYVKVTRGSPEPGGPNSPLGPGVYADALIPFLDPETGQPPVPAGLAAVPFDVEPGASQPVWVDLFVPRDAEPGYYRGAYVVSSDHGVFSGAVSLTVWSFTLPLQPALRSSFLVWTAPAGPAARELLRHKLNPSKPPAAEQRNLIDQFGLASADVGAWSGADIHTCRMSLPPSQMTLAKMAANQAPDLFLYNYTADEIDRCPGLAPTLRLWGRNLRAAGIKNLVTMAPTADLLDDGSGTGKSAVDIWVMLPLVFDRNVDLVRRAAAKGDEIWSYNALVQDGYSPKWQIDFAPINYRIQPGFLSASLGLKGLLYWRVDLWAKDPWVEVNAPNYERYPGDGMLLYPGAKVGIQGVAPSMRLKWLRDGVEDYEYVAMLEQAGQGGLASAIVAEAARSWSDWTQDPEVLLQTRQKLGQALDRLMRTPKEKRLPPGVPQPF